MGLKSQYTSQEWQLLQNAVLWVFHAVAGLDGVIDEKDGKALLDAFKGKVYAASDLVREVVESMADRSDEIIASFKKDDHTIPMGLMDAAELVEKKLKPEEAKSFKLGLLLLGTAFANASDHPGTREAVMTIAAILRLSPEDLKNI